MTHNKMTLDHENLFSYLFDSRIRSSSRRNFYLGIEPILNGTKDISSRFWGEFITAHSNVSQAMKYSAGTECLQPSTTIVFNAFVTKLKDSIQ